MPASEPASATYQRDHWPRTYAALTSCGNVCSEILAKLSDLYYNFKGELSLNQPCYLRNVAVQWTNTVAHALERNLALPHAFLVRGLKIIEALNNIYASVETRLYGDKHSLVCACSLCYIESESEEL